MLKKIGFAVVGLSLVASPFLASADTAGDVQIRIQALLAQIESLRQQIAALTISSNPVACTMEVRQCPDGSYVGRSGPSCEFASCGGATVPPVRGCPQIVRYLSNGSTGNDVVDLQTYFGIAPTGYFGPLTAAAVLKFQASEGLSQVGFVGPQTRSAFARRCGYTQTGGFSASPTRGVAPLAVNFTYAPKTDDSGQYYVEFGDGQGQLMNKQQIYCIKAPCISPSVASHTYVTAGTYSATVSRYVACLYSEPRCLMMQPAPLATLTITVTKDSTTTGTPSISGIDGPTRLAVGQSGTWSVRVNDSSGHLSYSVRWGDEAQTSSGYGTASSMAPWVGNSGTFTHAYATAGTYSPKFTVTNGNGQSASASVTVVIGTTNQIFSASPTSGNAPLEVTFTSGSTATLNFGDGSTNSYWSPVNVDGTGGYKTRHTYNSAGTYTAQLIGPCAGIDCFLLTNSQHPILGSLTITVGGSTNSGTFSASPISGAAPLVVSFSGRVGSAGYSIDFGDGTTSGDIGCGHGECPVTSTLTIVNANHTYTSSGTYVAKLRRHFTSNEGNCAGVDCNVVGSVTITVR